MGDALQDEGEIFAATVFLSDFSGLLDPRQQGKVAYPLDEILLLCLLAVLAGAECFSEIALFGIKKLGFLRRFCPFKHGTPDHGHLGAILAILDPEQFQRCFVAWVAAVTGVPAGVIAIDGKTVRRSGHKRSGKAAIHMVSAFAAGQRLVSGQVKVAEKSNEIIARNRRITPGRRRIFGLPGAGGHGSLAACRRPPIRPICHVPNSEARFVELLGEVPELKAIVAARHDEIARLKGLKARPSIKPGGSRAKQRGRGKVAPRVAPKIEVLRGAHPPGSQFKGYEPYQVQEPASPRERWTAGASAG
jgi:DDE_Tnp_1-associated